MPWKRKNSPNWYIRRKLGPFGRITRTLETRRTAVAKARETMLVDFVERGYLGPVKAWFRGDITLTELEDARAAGKLGERLGELSRSSASMNTAIEACLERKRGNVKASTVERYAASLKHFRAFVENRATKHGGEKDPEIETVLTVEDRATEDGGEEDPEIPTVLTVEDRATEDGGEEGPEIRTVLTTDVVAAFRGARLGAGAAKETVNNDMIAVSVLATLALDKGWLEVRPKVTKTPPRNRLQWLEAGKVKAYLLEVRERFRLLFELLIETGCRLGQAEALIVSDLRLESDDPVIVFRDNKGNEGNEYEVAILPETAAALRARVTEDGLGPADHLFNLVRRTVQKEHRRVCKKVGVHNYTIHDHRHTSAVHLVKAGMPIPVLQHRLGHRTLAMTMRYATFHPDYQSASPYLTCTRNALAPLRGVKGES